MKTFEGKLVSKSIKVGIVAARFNEFITSKLLSGALDGLLRHEVREDDVHVAWVPGAFEIPLVAAKMAKSGRYDAVIQGDRRRFSGKRRACSLWRIDHGEYRAGHRAGWHQGGQ